MACDNNNKTTRQSGISDCVDLAGLDGSSVSAGLDSLTDALNVSALDLLCDHGSSVAQLQETFAELSDMGSSILDGISNGPSAVIAKAKSFNKSSDMKSIAQSSLDKISDVASDAKDRAFEVGKQSLKGMAQPIQDAMDSGKKLYESAESLYDTAALSVEAVEVGKEQNNDIKSLSDSNAQDAADTQLEFACAADNSAKSVEAGDETSTATAAANKDIDIKKNSILYDGAVMAGKVVADSILAGICKIATDNPFADFVDDLTNFVDSIGDVSKALKDQLQAFEDDLHAEFAVELGCLSTIKDLADNGLPGDLCEIENWLDGEIDCYNVDFPTLPVLNFNADSDLLGGIFDAMRLYLSTLKICDTSGITNNEKFERFVDDISKANSEWYAWYANVTDEWNAYIDALENLHAIHFNSPKGQEALSNANYYGTRISSLVEEYNLIKQDMFFVESVFEHDIIPKTECIIVPRKFILPSKQYMLSTYKIKYVTYGDVLRGDLMYPDSTITPKCNSFRIPNQ
mgnify:CR=1 FL=1